MKRYIVQFSGGTGSWAAARRLRDTDPDTPMLLLFADTLMEDEDLYRFLDEAAANLGVPLLRLSEGRDPWQVFFDVRYLGNTRVDPCSRILKRDLIRDWLNENADPASDVIVLGIDYEEEHRYLRAAPRWEPFKLIAPLCDPPYVSKPEWQRRLVNDHGIALPRLYGMGFPHNNCGGFCVKAGQAHFANLLRTMPDRYAYHERREQELREHLGKDVAILRDRTGGNVTPITLREFRERLQMQADAFERFDWGGCACFTPDLADEPSSE